MAVKYIGQGGQANSAQVTPAIKPAVVYRINNKEPRAGSKKMVKIPIVKTKSNPERKEALTIFKEKLEGPREKSPKIIDAITAIKNVLISNFLISSSKR